MHALTVTPSPRSMDSQMPRAASHCDAASQALIAELKEIRLTEPCSPVQSCFSSVMNWKAICHRLKNRARWIREPVVATLLSMLSWCIWLYASIAALQPSAASPAWPVLEALAAETHDRAALAVTVFGCNDRFGSCCSRRTP